MRREDRCVGSCASLRTSYHVAARFRRGGDLQVKRTRQASGLATGYIVSYQAQTMGQSMKMNSLDISSTCAYSVQASTGSFSLALEASSVDARRGGSRTNRS